MEATVPRAGPVTRQQARAARLRLVAAVLQPTQAQPVRAGAGAAHARDAAAQALDKAFEVELYERIAARVAVLAERDRVAQAEETDARGTVGPGLEQMVGPAALVIPTGAAYE